MICIKLDQDRLSHLSFVSTFVLKEYLEKNLRDFLFSLVMMRIMVQRREVVLLRFGQEMAELELESEPLFLPLPLNIWPYCLDLVSYADA